MKIIKKKMDIENGVASPASYLHPVSIVIPNYQSLLRRMMGLANPLEGFFLQEAEILYTLPTMMTIASVSNS